MYYTLQPYTSNHTSCLESSILAAAQGHLFSGNLPPNCGNQKGPQTLQNIPGGGGAEALG